MRTMSVILWRIIWMSENVRGLNILDHAFITFHLKIKEATHI